MDLVDAICSFPNAKSVVEYSEAPCYRRSYSTINKALDEMRLDKMVLPRLISKHLPRPEKQPFWLLGVDVTPQPRPYAHTLKDRSIVYEPTVIKGNKPITIGHQYSSVVYLPEENPTMTGSWTVPVAVGRVPTGENKELIGINQIGALLEDDLLPFGRTFCVAVADSSYSKAECLHKNYQYPNLVTIARVRGSRVLYRLHVEKEGDEKRKGRPKVYGEKFNLSDETTWHEPDDQLTITEQSSRGKRYRIELQLWDDMLMPGKRKPVVIPMHKYPFTLIQVVRYHEDGRLACKKPMWLVVFGERRKEVTLKQAYDGYGKRYNIEHFFRFGKQKLLLSQFQTPEDWREENWWQLVHIAYAQLWLARTVATSLPRAWERNLPAYKRNLLSPSAVRRDFGRIIRQIGTPAQPPKPRGKSAGRPLGMKLTPRIKQPVYVKSRQQANAP